MYMYGLEQDIGFSEESGSCAEYRLSGLMKRSVDLDRVY